MGQQMNWKGAGFFFFLFRVTRNWKAKIIQRENLTIHNNKDNAWYEMVRVIIHVLFICALRKSFSFFSVPGFIR